MSDASRTRLLKAYIENEATPPGMFASFFKTPPENYHTSEAVEIDIQRSGEDVAIPIRDLSVEGHRNEATTYTNKKFVPPIYDEIFSIKSWETMKRRPGENPFDDVDFMATAFREVRSGMRRGENKIRRAIELQAAKVLQTGTVTLQDSDGNDAYAIDYKPKATHFPTTGTAWSGTGDKLGDLESLADVILQDGKSEPGKVILGAHSFKNLINDDKVRKVLDNRRIDLGSIGRPEKIGGGKYHGTISVGQYILELWTYGATYKDPQSGNTTKYLDDNKVVMLGDGRLDLTYGAIPMIAPVDPRLAALVLGRVSGAGVDLHTNAWLTQNNRTIEASVAARPLCIPTAIDTFGCLTTEV